MQKRYLRLIESQSKVKVTERTLSQTDHHIGLGNVWFVTLAAVSAGVFYFWAYYFWGDVWRALTGG